MLSLHYGNFIISWLTGWSGNAARFLKLKHMTKKQLIELLEPYPDDMEVCIPSTGEVEYNVIHSVKQMTLRSPDFDEEDYTIDAIVIDER